MDPPATLREQLQDYVRFHTLLQPHQFSLLSSKSNPLNPLALLLNPFKNPPKPP